MDSMPAVSLSLPSLPSLKSSDPETETKTQHVEDATTGTTAADVIEAITHGHLPRGVSESDTEKDKKWFIGSVDCGTTSSRFLVFDGNGNPQASHQIEFQNIYPQSGWHEHDPQELFESVAECINEATKEFVAQGHAKDQIKTIGITTQRETTICWDSQTGEPLYNAVVWPDTRTASLVRELKQRKGADELQDICGLPISTYPSGVKLLWMMRHVDAIKQAYDEGRLSFGTVDSWLIYKLNGGKEANVHVTDTTNASRTMFMNLKTREYDDRVLEFFQLDRKNITLPKIVPSSDKEAFGKLALTELEGLSITGCLGDQSAALVGQCGFAPGEAKNTYGTGCFLLYNVGTEPVFSSHGLLATVAYDFGGDRKPVYALEGSVAVAGSGVKFLMNNLGFIAHSSKITELAESVEDNGGVVFVTAFSGLFAPYWIDDAKGTLFGITAHTQRGHIARATLEATCYQTRAILDAMEKDSGHKLGSLAVDGGMSNSDLTMQTQANILGIKVDRPVMRETTALGAAIAAGFAVDIWKEFEELKEINKDDRTIFEPQISDKKRELMFKKWEQAVQMCRGWVLEEDEGAEDEKSKEEEESKVEDEVKVSEGSDSKQSERPQEETKEEPSIATSEVKNVVQESEQVVNKDESSNRSADASAAEPAETDEPATSEEPKVESSKTETEETSKGSDATDNNSAAKQNESVKVDGGLEKQGKADDSVKVDVAPVLESEVKPLGEVNSVEEIAAKVEEVVRLDGGVKVEEALKAKEISKPEVKAAEPIQA